MIKDAEKEFSQVSINQISLEIKAYQTVREIATQFKSIIECYVAKDVPIEGVSILSEDDLIQYLGKTMDLPKNRKLVFKVNGLAGTFVTVLRGDRIELFKRCIKAYNPELYQGL